MNDRKSENNFVLSKATSRSELNPFATKLEPVRDFEPETPSLSIPGFTCPENCWI